MGTDSSDGPCWYQNRQRKVLIDDQSVIDFLDRIAIDLAKRREFAVLVSSNEAVRDANRQFRGIPKTTDVLSFPDGEEGRLGDILIAARRAQQQANQFEISIEDEIKTLALHGVLHLMGHDHETDNGEMRALETKLRKRYGLPSSLIERVSTC
jgi:probable rRNA maturation factor